MRILWHGISPYWRTGYGVQTRLFAPLIRDLGHQVVIAQMGHPHPADRRGQFDGIKIIGPGDMEYLLPRPAEIRAAFSGHSPDLVLVLKDAWVLPGGQYRGWNTAHWCAVDSEPMSQLDRRFFDTSGARPVAMSLFGLAQMRKAGLSGALYVPHGVDTSFWSPGSRQAARRLLGLPQDVFIAGLNAANLGQPSRKAFHEHFAGFARFRARHPGSLLLAHTNPDQDEGTPLRPVADHLGIGDAVVFGAGTDMTELQMRTWYRSLDVLVNATYGEGFGITIAEALACGIPVIATDCSAMTEKVPPGAGWLVTGQRFWVPKHAAEWTIPSIPALAAALEKAHRARLAPAAELGAAWDAQVITQQYWKPVLEELAS